MWPFNACLNILFASHLGRVSRLCQASFRKCDPRERNDLAQGRGSVKTYPHCSIDNEPTCPVRALSSHRFLWNRPPFFASSEPGQYSPFLGCRRWSSVRVQSLPFVIIWDMFSGGPVDGGREAMCSGDKVFCVIKSRVWTWCRRRRRRESRIRGNGPERGGLVSSRRCVGV